MRLKIVTERNQSSKGSLGREESKERALAAAHQTAEDAAAMHTQQISSLREAVEKVEVNTVLGSQLHKDLEQAKITAKETAAAALKAQQERERKLGEEHEHAMAENDVVLLRLTSVSNL